MAVPQLEGWLTLADAADRIGISRQALHVRASRGQLATLRRVGQTFVIRESEAGELAAANTSRKERKNSGLSQRQVEMLTGMLHGSRSAGYSWVVPTTRALASRGLIVPGAGGHQLTNLGAQRR